MYPRTLLVVALATFFAMFAVGQEITQCTPIAHCAIENTLCTTADDQYCVQCDEGYFGPKCEMATDASSDHSQSWFEYVMQFTLTDNEGHLSTWTIATNENGDIEIVESEADTPSKEVATASAEEESKSLAMSAPVDSDDSTDCGLFLQTAFDVCNEQRCDFRRHRCHHHHHEEEEDQGEEEDVQAEEDNDIWEEKKDRRFRHDHRPSRVARQCRDAVQDAQDRMEQCSAKVYRSQEDPDFLFSYEDALSALVEANDGICHCGLFCHNPVALMMGTALGFFIMWAIVYAKMVRCVVVRRQATLGKCKSAALAVFLLPFSFCAVVCLVTFVTFVIMFPLFGIPLLLGFIACSVSRRYRRRMARRRCCQQQRQAASINLPTVRTVPAANVTVQSVPTATLVALPAGKPGKGDTVLTAIVV